MGSTEHRALAELTQTNPAGTRQKEFDSPGTAAPASTRAAESSGRDPIVFPGPSAGRKTKARLRGTAPRRRPSILSSNSGGSSELNLLLNRISTLSERPTLSEADWCGLRELVSRAVRQASEQESADAELRQLALTDELTGLYNRRGFLVLAMHQLKLCRRNAQPAMLFFADVDGLKAVNDLCGHAAGDELLVRCSATLRATFRESDIIARLDGDEFATFVSEDGQSEESIRTRLNANIAEQNSLVGTPELSISLGAARLDPRSATSLAELLMAADRAMYCEKRSRNRLRPGPPREAASD